MPGPGVAMIVPDPTVRGSRPAVGGSASAPEPALRPGAAFAIVLATEAREP